MTELTETSLENIQKFIPIRDAAKRVSYTTDYVGRLAREGKILAKREGRVWLVDVDSLKLFSLQTKADAVRRQEELKLARRLERTTALLAAAAPEKKLNDSTFTHVALLESAVVTVCLSVLFLLVQVSVNAGLKVGDFYQSVNLIGSQTNQALAISSLAEFTWPDWLWLLRYEKKQIYVETDESQTQADNRLAFDQKNHQTLLPPQIDTTNNTLVMPVSKAVVDQVNYIADRFSDEVLIDFYDSRQGTITVEFIAGEEKHYPFRLVNELVQLTKD